MKRFFVFLLKTCGIILGAVVIVNVSIVLGSAPYIYETVEEAPEADLVLVLGAAVYSNGNLTPLFKDRVDTAIALYNAKKVKDILVSGDNGTLEHNEVNPARVYLLKQGIPDKDIFLDHAGFDTYSTLYRARDVFGVKSVLITTQSFHLSRALFIARMLGLHAYGVAADNHVPLLKNYVRELFADEKAVFDVIVHRVPKYLGEPIPITPEGQPH